MRIVTLTGVYPPSEDTFFLADWLSSQKISGKYLLDLGTGTGYLAIFAALKGSIVTASDIQPKAILNTRYNARLNNVRVRTVLSDLFENISGKYDFILFNPPYLTPWESTRDVSWDGGWRIVKRFLNEVYDYLARDGCFAFVMEEDDNWRRIASELSEVVVDRNAFHLVRVIGCR